MTNEQGRKSVLHKKHVARLQREQQQSRIILYAFFGILAGVVLLLIYGWLDINYLQAQKPVAKVGDVEILVKEFEPRVRLQRQQLLNQYNLYYQYSQYGMDVEQQLQEIQLQLDTPELIGRTVLDQMINEELIRQEAAKRGITASEEEIQKELEAAFEYFPNGTPTPTLAATEAVLVNKPVDVAAATYTPGPTATLEFSPTPEFTATVTATVQPEGTSTEATATEGTPTEVTPVEPSATPSIIPTETIEPSVTPTTGPTSTPLPTATPYTVEGFETEVAGANDRMVKLGFEDNIYHRFFEAQILERKLKEALGADAAPAETEEQQVRARHILVDDFATAADLIERLKNGEDFATLAREFSKDGSAAEGGDLGWFGRGAMVPEFEAATFALENPGDFTDEPVQSSFGYHVIQLTDRGYGTEQLDAAKETAFQDWLTAAKEEYGVEEFDIWKTRVPSDPNFITLATEAAEAQKTAQAETLEALKGTETPKP